MSANTTADGIEALAIVRGLRERVRELEADAARLDWLEKSFDDDPVAKVPSWFSVFCDVGQEEPHPSAGQSLRAAIDSAMATRKTHLRKPLNSNIEQ